jgi:hypothetical protein
MKHYVPAVVWLILTAGGAWGQAPLFSLDMEQVRTETNPWFGVDTSGTVNVFQAKGMAVQDTGAVGYIPFAASPALGDLTGDKLLDLVVADPAGYFWFFQNRGTANAPKFDRGEVIPIFLHPAGCNKVQVTDANGDQKLDLVVGDLVGRVYVIPNIGTAEVPKFVQISSFPQWAIPTASQERLWGNYFAPFFFDWNKDEQKDLILGEGTFSANNIYLFLNNGTNRYTEKDKKILIRGYGKEHLTPQVVDWNNDGKPDILTGEREGLLSVYLNTSTGKDISFGPPQPVNVGSTNRYETETTPAVGDLNGDGLPDLLLGRTNGHVAMSLNKGVAGSPKFDAPTDVKSSFAAPQYLAPADWSLEPAIQSVFYLLSVVSADPKDLLAQEAGFMPPPGSPGMRALRFYHFDTQPVVFIDKFPGVTGDTRMDGEQKIDRPNYKAARLRCSRRVSLKSGTRYSISFWHRGGGFDKTSFELYAFDQITKKRADGQDVWEDFNYRIEDDFASSSGWTQYKKTVSFQKGQNAVKDTLDFTLFLYLEGGGSLYLDDFSIAPVR